ncbi:MAG: GNAT family N-acetyltransferase [Alphaproteobacteria bacterium]|nr:GNAT family N-acetyltransferase [Alphaproteobacteria bacterium]
MRIEAAPSLAAIDQAAWDAIANPPDAPFDPFISWAFLEAAESAGCATRLKGWTPLHLLARSADGAMRGAMPLYMKTHSYGEYVFDHAWADALHRAGGDYYPKLQCAAPFTPVPGRRLLARERGVRTALIAGAAELMRQTRTSSVHVTFAQKSQADELAAAGFLARTGVQFHWFNQGYRDFQDFLESLSSQKRKNLRKERANAHAACEIVTLTGAEITERDWDFFFDCYMDTGSRKWGSPYLNRAFFSLIGERLGERVVMFVARACGRPVAAALNLLGDDAIYGRYWGRLDDIAFLHFELCYYQAIEHAIARGLKRVEAGAQGEHKLARGYAPVPTYSAHLIAHPGLRHAIARYLESEAPAIAEEIDILAEHTPFKRLPPIE